MKIKALLITISLLLAMFGMLTRAQATLSLTSLNPNVVILGQQSSITLTGTGFIEETTVQVSNFGTVTDTFVNDGTLTIELPQSIVAGSYSLTVSNPTGESATLDNALTVNNPVAPVDPVVITQTEPQRMTTGQANTLSVLGSGFTSGATVRLVGYGLLQTTLLNAGALTATVPADIRVGQYTIEMTDGNGNIVASPNTLTIVARPAEPIPTATSQPLPTVMPITTLPSLGVSNFSTTPATISAGETTRLNFTVQNRGNQMARGIVVTLGNTTSFVVSGGLSSITIPDLMPNASYVSDLAVTATQEVTSGANTIPLQLTYRDTLGEVYTSDVSLSINVAASANQSQIVIDAYTMEPVLPEPGDTVTLRMTLSNYGNTTASQVAVQFAGTEPVLLPNMTGDTFVVGDMQPGVRTPLQASLILSTDAEDGVQLQTLTIRYIQDGEAKETTASITVNVATVDVPQPLLLLSSYDTGYDVLQPGTRFTLDISLQNVGLANATSTTVIFGTVESTGGGDPNDPNNGGSQNPTPSTTFAPLGTAGLSFIGDIASNETSEISQEFIVAGDVSSGIYSLPITLQYHLTDGTNKQETLSLSLVVIAPPRLRINPQNPLPEMLTAGEPIPVSLELANLGRTAINLTEATVTANNGEILEGASIQLETLAIDDDTSLMAMIMPLEEGTLEVAITLNYINDLGQPATFDLAYSAEVQPAPPPIEEPFEPEPVVEAPEEEVNWFGRIVMAFMGLGS